MYSSSSSLTLFEAFVLLNLELKCAPGDPLLYPESILNSNWPKLFQAFSVKFTVIFLEHFEPEPGRSTLHLSTSVLKYNL